jgi:hypothetical protein
MRDALMDLKTHGIERARFAGRFSGASEEGNLVLNDVMPPVGYVQHCWIPRAEWLGKVPPIGKMVEFTASIGEYSKGAGEEDLCLCHCKVIS